MADPTRPGAGPVNPRLSDERVAEIRRLVLVEAMDGPAPAPLRRRGRPLMVAVVASAGVLLVGGTAAAWVAASRPDDPYAGYCSERVTTNRDVWTRHGFGSAEQAGTGLKAKATVDTCAQMWRMGLVTDSTVPAGTVPKLTACVVDDAFVVYPGDAQVCSRLKVAAAITD